MWHKWFQDAVSQNKYDEELPVECPYRRRLNEKRKRAEDDIVQSMRCKVTTIETAAIIPLPWPFAVRKHASAHTRN